MSNGRKELSPHCLAHLTEVYQQAVALNEAADQDIQDANAAGVADVAAFFRLVHGQNVDRAAAAEELLRQWGPPAGQVEADAGGPPKIQTPTGDVIGGGGGGGRPRYRSRKAPEAPDQA